MAKRKGCLLKVAIIILSLPLVYIIGNPLSGHTLQAHIDNLKLFSSIMQTGKSPDGRYNIYVMRYGMRCTAYEVRLAKPWDISANRILWSEREGNIPYGPLGEVGYSYAIAWAQNGERCAIIVRGWYVDCYDIHSAKRNNRLPHGLDKHTDMEMLKAYHEEVVVFIGENPIIDEQ